MQTYTHRTLPNTNTNTHTHIHIHILHVVLVGDFPQQNCKYNSNQKLACYLKYICIYTVFIYLKLTFDA